MSLGPEYIAQLDAVLAQHREDIAQMYLAELKELRTELARVNARLEVAGIVFEAGRAYERGERPAPQPTRHLQLVKASR